MRVIHAHKMSRSSGYSKRRMVLQQRDTVTFLQYSSKPNYHCTSEMQKLVTFSLVVNITQMTLFFHVAIVIRGLLTMVLKELPI